MTIDANKTHDQMEATRNGGVSGGSTSDRR